MSETHSHSVLYYYLLQLGLRYTTETTEVLAAMELGYDPLCCLLWKTKARLFHTTSNLQGRVKARLLAHWRAGYQGKLLPRNL